MKKKIIIIALALLVLGIWTVRMFRGGIKLEMVGHGEMEKSYAFDALVIRDEKVINTQKSGVLESVVKDSQVVGKNRHVASIYESEIDDEAKSSLAAINARIDEITKARDELSGLAVAELRVESTMNLRTDEITQAIEDGNMEKVVSVHNELNLLNDKKNAMENGKNYTDDILNGLLESKAEYESKLGDSKEDLYSPIAGVYSTHMDGFEEIVTMSAIGTMTPYDFESIYKMKGTSPKDENSGAVCKIIDNSGWAVAFLASQKEISGFKEGSQVYVRTKNSEKDAKGRISYISTPVNGNYLVTVTSEESTEWANKERFISIDLIRNKYKGLKVPIKALHVADGKTGVYVVIDGIVYFKNVNVLYKDTSYAIVEEDNTAKGGLLLYDEVVVSSSKKLKSGDRIT